ncbi:hypothetical protein NDU88_010947 [Pleurodeles waltl]|uniref:Uncharacterized protein n=1 Tax=Pleurodeles waltl TaxID=8319 RepID=A0AAV7S401_PLEWA|nr:hypothetical protein NDU88_010947 [Pleurodeles waltl]
MLPGDSRQQQPLRSITRIEKEGGGDFGIEAVEGERGRGDQGGEAYNEDGDECGGGDGSRRTGRSSRVEVFPSDTQGSPRDHQHRGSSRGPGGSAPKLRPRSGESVASAGAWAGLTSQREVEGEKKWD